MTSTALQSIKALGKSRASCTDVVRLAGGLKLDDSEDALVAREIICKAALDCGKIVLAIRMLGELERRFPKSQRVALLRGMVLEAEGKFAQAQAIYQDLVAQNQSNLAAPRRIAALTRDGASANAAAQELNKLIGDNFADVEAWMEMADLQLSQAAFAEAAYCLEEVLLANPYHHACHTLYGEVAFTFEDKQGRAYFAQSLCIKPQSNPRAAWGLALCCAAEPLAADDNTKQLRAKALAMLRALYARSDMLGLVEKVLAQLDAAP